MAWGRSRSGRSSYRGGYGGFAPYVPVAQRRAEAAQHAKSATKKGEPLQPVEIEGRTIARTFWGKAFCDHLARFASMSNRLDRGRTYVRNGSVFHLAIERCAIHALVSGSEVYKVEITLKPAPRQRWQALTRECAGHIGSLVELLSGRFDDATLRKLIAPDAGLLPADDELTVRCSCPDGGNRQWVCKHVAAAMFGVGARLDHAPELLFTLRDVDPSELLAAAATADVTRGKARPARTVAQADLADVFGIELADEPAAVPPPMLRRAAQAAGKKAPKAPPSPAAAAVAPVAARSVAARSVAARSPKTPSVKAARPGPAPKKANQPAAKPPAAKGARGATRAPAKPPPRAPRPPRA